jgi:hypothetical protein
MRFAALLIVLLALASAGCSEVKKEIDKPGPAPPYDPKAAQLDPNLIPAEKPVDSPAGDPK